MWQTPFLTGQGRKSGRERLQRSNTSVLLSVLKVPEGFQMQIMSEKHQISETLTSCDLLFSDLQTQEKEEPIIREGSLKVSWSAVLHNPSRASAFPVEPLWALLTLTGCCCPVF